ncbi:MAG: hypothetical protein K2J83_04955 [Clostridia bacterium]|nr:hypothetical protein [Clostridia bacterium]
MKYCKNCGKELADGAVLCTGCGCATDDFYAQSNKQNTTTRAGEMSLMALLGFIFSFISSLVGLILSCIAYKTAVAENDEKSKTYSKAGIIISSVVLGISVLSGLIGGIIYGISLAAMIGGTVGGSVII